MPFHIQMASLEFTRPDKAMLVRLHDVCTTTAACADMRHHLNLAMVRISRKSIKWLKSWLTHILISKRPRLKDTNLTMFTAMIFVDSGLRAMQKRNTPPNNTSKHHLFRSSVGPSHQRSSVSPHDVPNGLAALRLREGVLSA
jgi:hypothetical protein